MVLSIDRFPVILVVLVITSLVTEYHVADGLDQSRDPEHSDNDKPCTTSDDLGKDKLDKDSEIETDTHEKVKYVQPSDNDKGCTNKNDLSKDKLNKDTQLETESHEQVDCSKLDDAKETCVEDTLGREEHDKKNKIGKSDDSEENCSDEKSLKDDSPDKTDTFEKADASDTNELKSDSEGDGPVSDYPDAESKDDVKLVELDVDEKATLRKLEVDEKRALDSSEGDSGDVKTEKVYEFPKLVVIDPGRVGDEVNVELEDGRVVKRQTRAIRTPVFTIPNFLAAEECDIIMGAAGAKGLNTSMLFGADLEDEAKLNGSDISRISQQTWLFKADIQEDFWRKLQRRVATLTQLPVELIHRGEPMQVVAYRPGGHYHAHIDTATTTDRPCCFQTRCGEKENTDQWDECCRLCRFMTVLYYLNDVEEGGETAFPLADLSDDVVDEKFASLNETRWHNLSLHCHDSPLVVKPQRGMAVMWYNTFIDPKTGYLGEADRLSHHGGCDLIKGTKWIANTWISGTTFQDRFKESHFYGHI